MLQGRSQQLEMVEFSNADHVKNDINWGGYTVTVDDVTEFNCEYDEPWNTSEK